MTPAKTNYGSITIFGWLHVWKIRQLTLDQLTPADLKLEGISDSTQTIAEFTAEHFPDIPTTTAVFDVTEGGQKKTKVVFLVRFKFLSAQSALPENVLELHNVWGSEEACQCKVCNACTCGLGNAGNHTCSVCNRCVHSGFDVDCSTWKGIDKENATYTCAPCGALTSDQEKVKDPPQEKEKDKVEEEKEGEKKKDSAQEKEKDKVEEEKKEGDKEKEEEKKKDSAQEKEEDKVEEEKKERDKEKEEEKKKDSAHKEKEEEKKEQQQKSEQPQEQEQQQESEQPQDQEQQQESEQ